MSSTKNKITVSVLQGKIFGEQDVLPNGEIMYAFRGIPYATPPIGELRFKAPKSMEKFNVDILDCTKERNISLQRNSYGGALAGVESDELFVGSEDCLFLNVYTPKLPNSSNHLNEKLAVIVWIHGGAYLMGSGNAALFSPEYILQENVIVVTLNYRLGPFGFLHLPKAGIEGNAGLKDQLLALKWVKENIATFNGNPNNITLMGESAGATSVHFHFLSQNSRQFFHKAICQSGTSNMQWAAINDTEYKAKKLAKLIGCESTNDNEILKFLQQASLQDIAKNAMNVLSADEKRRGLPLIYTPVIEEESENAIITKNPVDILALKNLIDIPLIVGKTSSEGIIMLPDAIKKLEIFDTDVARMIPKAINVKQGTQECEDLAKVIKKFYFNDKPICDETLSQFTDLMTDYHFGIDLYNYVEIHSRHQFKSNLYLYQFAYDGELNVIKKMMQINDVKGACHADDIYYLFKNNFMDIDVPVTSEAGVVRQKMCRLWANFAKYGNPTPKKDNLIDFIWKPVDKLLNKTDEYHPNCLVIDKNIEMSKNLEKNRQDFWRGIYTKYNGDIFNFSVKPKL